jgi:hypothetical protein
LSFQGIDTVEGEVGFLGIGDRVALQFTGADESKERGSGLSKHLGRFSKVYQLRVVTLDSSHYSDLMVG